MGTHRSWVFHGRQGSGKTTLLGTFPKPLLLLDMSDKGDDSLAGVEGIEVMDVSSYDDLDMVYWYLKKNPDRYKTVGIDTVTGAQELGILKKLGGKVKKGKRPGDWGTMTKQGWGQVSGELKTMISDFRDLTEDGLEVVFLAQERVFNVDEEADPEAQLDPEIGPRLMPSVMSHLNASVHVVGSTYIRRKIVRKKVKGKMREVPVIQYCLRVGPNPVYATKVRKPRSIVVPSMIVDPHYDKLIATIEGKKE